MAFEGVARASVKFKPTVLCGVCGQRKATADVDIMTSVVDISQLQKAIDEALKQPLIHPPVGWAINGRGNYTCEQCLER